MSVEAHDVAGIVGVTLILGAYLMLQIGRIEPRGAAYSAVNALGAGLVVVSLCYDFNLSALVVELFWIAISLYGLGRALLARRRPAEGSSVAFPPSGDRAGAGVVDRQGPDE